MHASVGKIVVLAVPVLLLLAFLLLGLWERRALGRAAGPSFLARNGAPVAIWLVLMVGFWTIVLIVLPLLYMVDLSFRPKLPPAQVGGPRDLYTLDNYRFFLFGGGFSASGWNDTHIQAFLITILASILITSLNLVLCYPLAFYMAKVAPEARLRLLMLLLVTPYWVNEILRAFAFRILFGTQGVLNKALLGAGLLAEPIDFIGQNVALYAGLSYAYLLLMVFPLYNAIESLDRNQLEAARDLGAPWWRIHLDIVIPHSRPGIASGTTLVFMLTAGALAAPQVLSGPNTLWFTPIVYDRFYQAFNWPQGAAYAFILLVTCIVFVLGVLRLFRLGLGEMHR